MDLRRFWGVQKVFLLGCSARAGNHLRSVIHHALKDDDIMINTTSFRWDLGAELYR